MVSPSTHLYPTLTIEKSLTCVCFQGAFSCIVQLLILCVLGRYLAATIPALAVALFFIQRYYLQTSRQIRLLDIEAKAPLLKHFLETCSGLATIRAFRWSHAFHNRLREILNMSQAPFYMLFCVQQWLVLVLDLTVGSLAVVVVMIAMLSVDNPISGGSLGVSLTLLLNFNALLSQTVQAWTKLETSIGAVARVQGFVRDTPSEPTGSERASPEPNWPSQGLVNFRNIVACHG